MFTDDLFQTTLDVWKTFYPYVKRDGLSLFEAQVQLWPRIPELCIFTDFIFLFHPPEEKTISANEKP